MKKNFRLFLVTVAIIASSLLSACDNGGTFNPDGGCIGQGASFDQCSQQVQAIGK